VTEGRQAEEPMVRDEEPSRRRERQEPSQRRERQESAPRREESAQRDEPRYNTPVQRDDPRDEQPRVETREEPRSVHEDRVEEPRREVRDMWPDDDEPRSSAPAPAAYVPPAPAAPAYVPPAPLTAFAAFHAVSEHDEVAEEAHRPVRKRRQPGVAGSDQPAPLQIVETQAATPPPIAEDELPRRTKPRKRRGASADSEPLKLVETQNVGEAPQADTPPTP
jgi:hypothetical protein